MPVFGRHRIRLLVAMAVAIAGTVIWWRWPEPQADQLVAVSHGAAARSPIGPGLLGGSHPRAASGAVAAGVADPLGSAPDLKQTFDAYVDSADPGRRRIAARAFAACVPAFLPAAGQTPSPEPLIEALPPERRSEREAAYRALFSRCHRFLAESREALDGTSQVLQRDRQNEPPGLRAQNALLAGPVESIEPLVAEALSGSDPAAVESLAGIASRIAQSRSTEAADIMTLQRAAAVDTAMPWVACDLGLECAAQSLWALQLCAAEGLCEGDLPARLMARISPGRVDPDAVQRERARLLGLIRSGRRLGTADLLP